MQFWAKQQDIYPSKGHVNICENYTKNCNKNYKKLKPSKVIRLSPTMMRFMLTARWATTCKELENKK